MFATISNFSDFYSESQGNNHGLECLRLLNEIICDFDSILDDERFKAVDKIKTIGSTYMAAIGLFPNYEFPSIESLPHFLANQKQQQQQQQLHPPEIIANTNANIALHTATATVNQPKCSRRPSDGQPSEQQSNKPNDASNSAINFATRREVARYLQILVRFVIEMKDRLKDINEHSYNNFKLRVGINLGPVIAGVIGATKPQYDIWGNTVNVASRMESTADANRIQITDDVYQILNEFNEDQGFKFTCRGSINVKGKGFMTTYYLDY